ncbi:MAG: peptide ABC transporter substrate-binding protein [Chloroflexi bacterium]|nr:peptide ABC transporter substrate-binding protein [Chloroflexota bacterium]
MKRNWIYALVAVLVSAVMLLSACTPSGGGGNKVVTFIFTQEPETLNLHYTNMYFSSILQQLWNHWAWEYDENNNPYPVLITEMPSMENGGISADGTVLTLTLRDDIFWSDGEPITADDFVFTWEMAVAPTNTVATTYPYSEAANVEAPDPQTVVVTFAEPFAPWLYFFHGLLPKHVLQPVFDAEGTLDNADWNNAPTVGSGPFSFAEWESGSFLRFVRNEEYWGEPALVDEIFVRIVPDDASQVAALVSGEGDIGIFIAYPDIPSLEEGGLSVIKVFSGYNEGWYLNMGPNAHPALLDVRVRQALAYGTDRFIISRDLLLDKTVPASTFWDGSPWTDPTLEPYPYDPNMANDLLDQAGWVDSNGDGTRDKDGVELVLRYLCNDRDVRMDMQAVIQQQLAQIGVGVELFNYDSDILFGSYGDGGPVATGNYDIAQWSDLPGGFPDPDSAYWLCSEIPSDESPQGSNWQYICDEELNNLFLLQKTQMVFDDRVETFHQISRIMYEQVYFLGIWQDPDIWAVSSRLSDVKISGVTPFFNIAEWDIP